jgi:hypothetical protein
MVQNAALSGRYAAPPNSKKLTRYKDFALTALAEFRKGSAGVPPAVFGVSPNTFSSAFPSGATPDGATGTVALPHHLI